MNPLNEDNGSLPQSSNENIAITEQELEDLDIIGTQKLTIENENSSDEDDLDESIWDDDSDFIQNLDPESLLTSKEALDQIIEYDSTVHVIGVVTNVQAPIYKGENNVLLFKWTIENKTGQRTQLYAWNEDAKRVSPFIQPNHVIHVDGAFARAKDQRFSNGNTKMDLTVRGNTTINVLKKIAKISTVDEAKLITIEDVWNEHGLIKIEAYLKAELKATKTPFTNCVYETGCIAQNRNKIEIRVKNGDNKITIERGAPISIIGTIIRESTLPHILIQDYTHIKKMSGHNLTDKELMNACVIPKRKLDDTTSIESKKMKQE